MNPADYQPRTFLWKQGDWRWGYKKIGMSGLLVKNYGCAILSVNYLNCRRANERYTPDRFIDWLNVNAKAARYQKYLAPGGELYWNAINEYSGGKMLHTYDVSEARYSVMQVKWGNYLHWIACLNDDLAYDPWDGQIKKRIQPYWYATGRKIYFKVVK